MLVSCFGLSTSFLAALRAISSMRKRPHAATDSVVEPDAVTEHMTINSLDDVVSKLAFECDESAAVLRNAVQTLQGGVQAEVRNLCSRWNVQLTTKNDNGKYSKRADHILKSELENTFIAKAKEHFRAKATENQPIQLKKETDAPTSSSATERAASVATEHASVATEHDYLAKCQQQARHTYTLPPCVSSDGLSEKQIARGDFYLRPNDRYTKRQQDLSDMDEDDGSEACSQGVAALRVAQLCNVCTPE